MLDGKSENRMSTRACSGATELNRQFSKRSLSFELKKCYLKY
jgi:hypothetical protein